MPRGLVLRNQNPGLDFGLGVKGLGTPHGCALLNQDPGLGFIVKWIEFRSISCFGGVSLTVCDDVVARA